MTLAPDQAALGIERRFTTAGTDPADALEWEQRDARLIDHRDGSVTDKVTGLTWCLLDSRLELDTCIPFTAAKTYVQALTTGGVLMSPRRA